MRISKRDLLLPEVEISQLLCVNGHRVKIIEQPFLLDPDNLPIPVQVDGAP